MVRTAVRIEGPGGGRELRRRRKSRERKRKSRLPGKSIRKESNSSGKGKEKHGFRDRAKYFSEIVKIPKRILKFRRPQEWFWEAVESC